MYTMLAFQLTVRKGSSHFDNACLDPGFLTSGALDYMRCHASLLCPAYIHTLQHFSKILRVSAADARCNTENNVMIVEFASIQEVFSAILKFSIKCIKLRRKLRLQTVITKFHKLANIINLRLQCLP